MAIKGKRRPKQRPAPRAPRHVPVPVPTPLLRRTWVQLSAGFLLGVLVTVVAVWVTNDLRAGDAEEQADSQAAQRRTAATSYQQAVRGAFSQVGVVDQGVPPTIFTEMSAALDDLAEGKPPADAEEIFEQAADDAAKARKDLESFDVTAAVADRGFDAIVVGAYTDSAETLLGVLDRYRQAAEVAGAAAARGTESQRVADVALELRDVAAAELVQGWTDYLQALRASGVPEGPTTGGIVPELPGGGG